MTGTPFILVGMLHLPPLPGIANYHGTPMTEIIDQAVADAVNLTESGFTHLMLQNACDVPAQITVEASTVAIMTRIAREVTGATSLPLGINVAHNDGPAAVAIAFAVGATFIRVKLLTGAAVGPAGLMEGCALATAGLRNRLDPHIQIWADVNEATSLALAPAADDMWAATEAVKFGGADALIITKESGVDEALEVIRRLRPALPSIPLIVGGRVTAATIRQARIGADGAIIGGALKVDSGFFTRVNTARARAFTTQSPSDAA